ncbi:MAG: ABC transporter ATP-binding protein [Actinobacteria bacterium]|nr:ABC transporter ATP-binding protein [Actinomycetota bacterium]
MPVLEVGGVTKRYKRGPVANDDITLSVDAGEVFGLLGPNGAGKTTLIGQVLGLVKPTSGSITIDGADVVAAPGVARQACSYQPQSSVPIDNLTPREAIELAGRIRGGRRSEMLARADLLLQSLDLMEWADKRSQLSGGVARLVAFCMAAVEPGRVVILDEPTNDVDPLRRKLLWTQVRALADNGAAVLLVTHNVLEAERCVDRLAIIDHGRVMALGTPADLKTALGAPLRLELVLEPGGDAPTGPSFAPPPVQVGRRVFVDVDPGDVAEAVTWARDLQAVHAIAEFAVAPASLEDVYVRRVQPAEADEEVEHVAAVG